ncbi:cytidylyltransferase domain-containing protein [Kordiimonas aquimaris]|uniref:cytidylyltransferase domain-containing protein n=1 Tax=Kordiimonas aquimaris TaxID=707591 RepID=UPI0021CE8EF4|nr:NTP transferase domain-containing protein [Kordiimonas aquimaris]
MASKVIAIIGARLGSSRLPGKQLLPLVGKPLIARLVDRLQSVAEIEEIVIATTASDENIPLCEWAKSYGTHVFAWGGDEDDLVGRVDAVVKEYDATTFVYVCGDCPMVEPSTISALLRQSISMPSDGIAKLKPSHSGLPFIHEGFDVFNLNFWRSMVSVAHEPFEREHIGAVYHHLNKVEPSEVAYLTEDQAYAEFQHRLSVDTPDDYAFMTRVYNEWYCDHADNTLVDLKWLIHKLKSEPELVAINANVRQKTVHDTALRVAILCEAGPQLGLGHLTRSCVVASALKNQISADVNLFIKADPFSFKELDYVKHNYVRNFSSIRDIYDVVILDLKAIDHHTNSLLGKLNDQTLIVGVDIQAMNADLFDLVWMPSVHVPQKLIKSAGTRLRYGMSCYLLRDPNQVSCRPDMIKEKSVIVLTGGADPIGLSQTLPEQIRNVLADDTKITWVRGPYANEPNIDTNRENFVVLNAPEGLHGIISEHTYSLCVYGVTFYECLRAGVPTVVFDPIGAATKEEWTLLKELLPELVADDIDDAFEKLNKLNANGYDRGLSEIAEKLADGPNSFADTVKTFHTEKRKLQHATA